MTRWIDGYTVPLAMLVVAALPPYTLTSLLLWGVGVLALGGIYVRRNRRIGTTYRKMASEPEHAVYLGEKSFSARRTGLVMQHAGGSTVLDWDRIEEIVLTGRLLLGLMTTSAIVIPRAQVDAEVEKALITRGRELPEDALPSSEPVEVEARASFVEDEAVRHARVRNLFRRSTRQRVRLVVVGALLGLVVARVAGQPLEDDPVAALLGTLALSPVALIVAEGMTWEARRRYVKSMGAPEQIEVLLTATGVLVRTPGELETVYWTALGPAHIELDGVRLPIGAGGGIFVPRGAFPSDAAMQDFALRAMAHMPSGQRAA